jgi:predicted P-loop ATPase
MSKAKRWTVWTARQIEGKKKPSKVPASSPTDPSTWTTYNAARATLDDPKIAGVGYEMFGASGIIGIDLDNCVLDDGAKTAPAQQLLALLERGRFYVEISPGGNGLRIFARSVPLPYHDFTNHETGVEVYSGESGRFLAFTGALCPPGVNSGEFDDLPVEAVTWLGKHASKWKQGAARVDGVTRVQSPEVPLPELDRREDWEALHPGALAKLGAVHRRLLRDGAVGDKYASASEHLFAVEQALVKHLKPAQAYQILISANGSWGVALEHREGSYEKAKRFIWDDLQRAAASKDKYDAEKAVAGTEWKECDIIVEMGENGARAKFLQLNMINALQRHPAWMNRLAYNTFDGRVTVDRRESTVRNLAEMSAWMCEFLHWHEPPRVMFEEAVIEAARTRPWNPMEEELRGYVWDGQDRLPGLVNAMVDSPTALDLDLLRKWLISYVARGINPGCEVHTVLALREQDGGGFKTKFCKVMAGGSDRYSDSSGFGSDKDSSMLRVGMRVIELGEGVAVKRSDRFDLKRDITKTEDYFRAPWGRVTERRLRGFVYVLTTNEEAFLRSDQDGLRRIWPINAKPIINIEWVEANRTQLLAQAVALYDAHTPWWYDKGAEPDELLVRQGTAVQADQMDEPLKDLVHDPDFKKKGYIQFSEVCRYVESHQGRSLNTFDRQHLMTLMSKHEFKNLRIRVGGRTASGSTQIRAWVHPKWDEIDGFGTPEDGGEPEGGGSGFLN